MSSRGDILQSLKKELELDKVKDLSSVIHKCYQSSIDEVLCANNQRCSEYGQVSYYQGFRDAVSYLIEVCQYT